MPRRPNPTVGMVECPHCHELAAVRKAADGRFYYQCMCSRQPVHAHDYVLEHAELWGDNPAPEHAPDWIAKGLRFKPGARETGDRPRAPAKPEPGPPLEPASEPGSPVPAGDVDDVDDDLPGDDDDRIAGGLFL